MQHYILQYDKYCSLFPVCRRGRAANLAHVDVVYSDNTQQAFTARLAAMQELIAGSMARA